MGSGFDSGFDWGFILPEIQDVLDAIVVLQKAVPAPTGEKDITHAYDEQPESASTFPCFINIDLCFEQGSGIYADRSRRLWYQAVMDYFDQHQGLNDTAHWSAIERAAFDEPLQITETLRYPGIKFELKVLMKASTVTLAV